MKKAIAILILSILLLAGLPIQLVQAHNGPARIEVGAERVAPGVALEVRGVNIAPEQPVTLTLVGGGQEFGFGTVVGNEHGDFIHVVTVPREAQAGAYTLRAFGINRVMVAVPIVIVGSADEEQGQQREEEEPLLAPMPRPQPAVQANVPATTSAPVAAQSYRPAPWLAIALAVLAAVVGLTILARRRTARAIE